MSTNSGNISIVILWVVLLNIKQNSHFHEFCGTTLFWSSNVLVCKLLSWLGTDGGSEKRKIMVHHCLVCKIGSGLAFVLSPTQSGKIATIYFDEFWPNT